MIYNIPADKEFFEVLHSKIIEKLLPISKNKTVIILLPTKLACNSFNKILTGHEYKNLKIHSISDLSELITLKAPYKILGRMGLVTKISKIILAMNLPKFQDLFSVTPLAEYFANFIQSLELQQVNLDHIMQVIDEDLSLHQQELFAIFKNFINLWQQENFISKAGHNNLLINKLADNLTDKIVVMAGISYYNPSIIKLMEGILENEGHLVFYGVDSNLTESDWNNVDITHSQYNFKQIFSKLGITSKDIKNTESANSCFISQALKPAKSCANWYQQQNFGNIPDIKYLNCRDLHHEAKSIINIINNSNAKDVLIITADDALMVKIILNLKAANIEANIIRDYPLSQSEVGIWLKLCLNLLKENFSLLSSLALLKYPFTDISNETIKAMEDVIRSKDFYGSSIFDIKLEDAKFNLILESFQKIKAIFFSKTISFHEMLQAHLDFAQELSYQNIWENAKELQDYLEQLKENTVDLGNTRNYHQIFDHFIQSAYHRPESSDYNITLLKPIDARLHKADLVILSGLNEGKWPTEPKIDPFLNRQMLQKMNLKQIEQEIGEEAYDFQCFVQNKQVILTRSEKISGVITTPSRWLLRILTLARNSILPFVLNKNDEIYFMKAIEVNDAPCPKLELRPSQLSATQIDKLVFNPYHIYVDTILNLKKLPPLKKEISALDFGIFVHKALEIYHCKRKSSNFEILLEAGKQALAELNLRYTKIELIYWTRFLRIAKWFVSNENISNKTYLEASGKMLMEGNFILIARADRIEIAADNSLIIIDYKTGRIPTASAVRNGKNLQLLLEGMLGKNGKFFFQKSSQEVKSLIYIGLSGGDDPVEFLEIDLTEDNIIERAEEYVCNLIKQYQDPSTPYYYTKSNRLGYCEYSHLARKF